MHIVLDCHLICVLYLSYRLPCNFCLCSQCSLKMNWQADIFHLYSFNLHTPRISCLIQHTLPFSYNLGDILGSEDITQCPCSKQSSWVAETIQLQEWIKWNSGLCKRQKLCSFCWYLLQKELLARFDSMINTLKWQNSPEITYAAESKFCIYHIKGHHCIYTYSHRVAWEDRKIKK